MYLEINDRIIRDNLEYMPIYKACLLQQQSEVHKYICENVQGAFPLTG